MKTTLSRFFTGAALAALLLSAGCRTVDEGPVVTPDPNQPPVITGKEPAPAAIPQKADPGSASPLDHKTPDERIDQPKG